MMAPENSVPLRQADGAQSSFDPIAGISVGCGHIVKVSKPLDCVWVSTLDGLQSPGYVKAVPYDCAAAATSAIRPSLRASSGRCGGSTKTDSWRRKSHATAGSGIISSN